MYVRTYVGTESVKAQNGRIGSGVAAPAGAKLADGSTPQHAGQAGSSKGGKNKSYLNRPSLKPYELCSEVDPATGKACIKKRESQVRKGKRYFKRYCSKIIVGSTRKRCHDFRRNPDEPWP